MDNRYNRHNRRKYSLKVHIVLVTKYRKQLLKDSIADDVNDIANTYGTNMVRFCLNSIGKKKYFGQTDILLAALEKYRQLPYKNILSVVQMYISIPVELLKMKAILQHLWITGRFVLSGN